MVVMIIPTHKCVKTIDHDYECPHCVMHTREYIVYIIYVMLSHIGVTITAVLSH